MDLKDLTPEHRTPHAVVILLRICSIFGALLVLLGLAALLLPLMGQSGGGLHEAKYLLLVGGLILVVAQFINRD